MATNPLLYWGHIQMGCKTHRGLSYHCPTLTPDAKLLQEAHLSLFLMNAGSANISSRSIANTRPSNISHSLYVANGAPQTLTHMQCSGTDSGGGGGGGHHSPPRGGPQKNRDNAGSKCAETQPTALLDDLRGRGLG